MQTEFADFYKAKNRRVQWPFQAAQWPTNLCEIMRAFWSCLTWFIHCFLVISGRSSGVVESLLSCESFKICLFSLSPVLSWVPDAICILSNSATICTCCLSCRCRGSISTFCPLPWRGSWWDWHMPICETHFPLAKITPLAKKIHLKWKYNDLVMVFTDKTPLMTDIDG